jgi:hypothetical protein
MGPVQFPFVRSSVNPSINKERIPLHRSVAQVSSSSRKFSGMATRSLRCGRGNSF